MKICIFNGSPKGDDSVTMQYVRYLKQLHPEHEYQTFNVAQRIKALEKNPEEINRVFDSIQKCDGVLWAFPLYILLVHAGYKRFIELIFENSRKELFRGKYAATISTSIHFYDDTAHSYMREIIDDLGMRFTYSHAAAMRDLLDSKKREQFTLFCSHFLSSISQQRALPGHTPPITDSHSRRPAPADPAKPLATQKRAVILTNSRETGDSLPVMMEHFREIYGGPLETIDLAEHRINGSCMGCLRCGFDNICSYDGKDDFIPLYRRMLTSDIIIFAFPVKDRFLSSGFKTVMDRSFFKTHQPSLRGKQILILTEGPLSGMHTGRRVLEAWLQIHYTNLIGMISDEDPENTLNSISAATALSIEQAEAGYFREHDFLGVAGQRLFRDEIYGPLGFVFQADHKYYKQNGFYDFPQRNPLLLAAVRLAQLISRILPMRKNIWKKIRGNLTRAYQPLFQEKE